MMKAFERYGEAKRFGDELVKGLAKGSRQASLTSGEADDASMALKRLRQHQKETGQELNLATAIDAYCSILVRANGKPIGDILDAYFGSIAKITPIPLSEAMTAFLKERKELTIPREEGKRPKLSPEHHYNTSRMLLEFSNMFPNHKVSDLTKASIALFMKQSAKLTEKTRNEKRGCVKQFLNWCVEQDYMSATSPVLSAKDLQFTEDAPDGEIEAYSPSDFKRMLERASRAPTGPDELDYREFFPLLLLAGLAGMRWREAMRMEWEDLFRRVGHIEVVKSKAKTRSRRLIKINAPLALWLEPFRNHSGLIWSKSYDQVHWWLNHLLAELEIKERRNGLRHGWISAMLATTGDENETSVQAGNSPEQCHSHYNALMTKAEGEAWLGVAPQLPANVVPMTAATK